VIVPRPRLALLAVSALVVAACTNDDGKDHADPGSPTTAVVREASPLRDLPLPPPAPSRDSPEVTLADPAFDPVPGARAEYGTLGGAAYQIEIPDRWNGGLVMWMHGYEELGPQANATPPDFRRYLIANGFAWAASSFSSTSFIPGRAVDETAALWDHVVREHGRPDWTYAAGLSMGGWSAHIAAERYANRFDGALGLCGATGTSPGLSLSVDMFVAGAYVAGVTQAEFDAAPSVPDLIAQRIRPALDDPTNRARFEALMIDLTGGPRAFDRAGFRDEEGTNWERAELLVSAQLAAPRTTPYELGPGSGVSSEAFNRAAIRVPTDREAFRVFSDGIEVTGDLRMPLVTMHTTGDGQVPINQAQTLRRRVDEAGRGNLLVQRVIEDPGHCGFTTGEQEAAFQALVDWVERGRVPDGTNLDVDDLTSLDRTFELAPRPDSDATGPSSPTDDRAVIRGRATLDGAPLDARWIGAVVLGEGLVTACNTALPAVADGEFEVDVYAGAESAGCGQPGAEVLLWTYVGEQKLYATTAIPWPGGGTARADIDFATRQPLGAAPTTTEFGGEVYDRDGQRVPPGSRVEAYIGETLCGVASVRWSDFYILTVAGPDSVPECAAGGTITFRVDGTSTVETAANSPGQSTHLDLTL
jgi:hypothetical protein